MTTDYTRYDLIRAELEESGILRINLCRPEKRNIIDDFVNRQISDVFLDATMDDRVRVVVLSGDGDVFCGGGDFKQMKRKVDDPGQYYRGMAGSRRLVYTVLECPKPTIAKIHGTAAGLGATLPLLCDFVVATDDTTILDPHVNVGLLGFARAKRFLMLGEPIMGKEAADIGLIAASAPDVEGRDAIAEKWAAKLASGAAQSISGTKMTINVPLRQLAQAMMDVGMAYEGLSNISKDHREAVDAFLEKRKPSFTGD
jgi:enoyl-CoA hydratase